MKLIFLYQATVAINTYSYKICMDKVNVSITNKCSYGGEDEFWNCPKANKGLAFEQCYNM